MKKCTICGSKITKKNDAGVENLKKDLTFGKTEYFLKIQTVCMECKKDLLYASIVIPY